LSQQLFVAVQRFLARSPSCLLMVQLEDMLGQTKQVNVPGTIEEYPNWRQKVPLELEDWNRLEDIAQLAAAINLERSEPGSQD
jgi:4-alpha-glucanotransferase